MIEALLFPVDSSAVTTTSCSVNDCVRLSKSAIWALSKANESTPDAHNNAGKNSPIIVSHLFTVQRYYIFLTYTIPKNGEITDFVCLFAIFFVTLHSISNQCV